MSERLKASLTVEAALVVSVALMAIVSVMKWDIKLHDSVVTAAAANETAELYGHMSEQDTAAAASYGNARLGRLFSGDEYSLSLEGDEHGSEVSLSGSDRTRVYTDSGFEPEYFMRMMTLLEGVTSDD